MATFALPPAESLLDEPSRRRFLDELAARLDLLGERVHVAGEEYLLVAPSDTDQLLDIEAFDKEGRVAYWGVLWNSAKELAERIAAMDGGGRRLLELGAGLGLVSTVALRRGFDVLATDYYAESLDFARVNAALNGAGLLKTRLLDWRRFPADLGTFDMVVGSDLLYEKENARLVASVVARSLAAGGLAVIADPGRLFAETFPAHCEDHGLVARSVELATATRGEAGTVQVMEVRWG